MARRFDGLVAWVTGGSAGIGRALCLELAARGAKVAVSGRRQDRLDEVVAEITARGGVAIAVPCDVVSEDSLARAIQTIIDTWGRLDVAVANAGLSVSNSIENASFEEWRLQLDTNVIGAALTARHAIPPLKATAGRLVLVGSVIAFLPVPGNGPYAASKVAIRAIGQILQIELRKTGITTTIIHPGFVKSEIAQVDNTGVFDPSRADKRPSKLMWETDDAAKVMADAIHRRAGEYVFTGHGKLGAFLGQNFPTLVRWAMPDRV